MLSIIGSLLGFASSTAPAIMDHFQSKDNRKHEIDKMKTLAEIKAQGIDLDMKVYDQMGADKLYREGLEFDTRAKTDVLTEDMPKKQTKTAVDPSVMKMAEEFSANNNYLRPILIADDWSRSIPTTFAFFRTDAPSCSAIPSASSKARSSAEVSLVYPVESIGFE